MALHKFCVKVCLPVLVSVLRSYFLLAFLCVYSCGFFCEDAFTRHNRMCSRWKEMCWGTRLRLFAQRFILALLWLFSHWVLITHPCDIHAACTYLSIQTCNIDTYWPPSTVICRYKYNKKSWCMNSEDWNRIQNNSERVSMIALTVPNKTALGLTFYIACSLYWCLSKHGHSRFFKLPVRTNSLLLNWKTIINWTECLPHHRKDPMTSCSCILYNLCTCTNCALVAQSLAVYILPMGALKSRVAAERALLDKHALYCKRIVLAERQCLKLSSRYKPLIWCTGSTVKHYCCYSFSRHCSRFASYLACDHPRSWCILSCTGQPSLSQEGLVLSK